MKMMLRSRSQSQLGCNHAISRRASQSQRIPISVSYQFGDNAGRASKPELLPIEKGNWTIDLQALSKYSTYII